MARLLEGVQSCRPPESNAKIGAATMSMRQRRANRDGRIPIKPSFRTIAG
jgi:hypothetical protein